jgi:DNA polymerase
MLPKPSSIASRRCDVEPRERLKRYLEQRRELGETELVLDRMTVDDVMRIVGASGAGSPPASVDQAVQPPIGREQPAGPPRTESRPVPPTRSDAPPVDSARGDAPVDWRDALRASGVDPSVERSGKKPAVAPPSSPPLETSAPAIGDSPPVSKRYDFPKSDAAPPVEAPAGLIVGTAARDLFGPSDARPATLDDIARAVAACTRCRLYATATNPVPGEGSPTAELVCVGEAPGANEDATGRPFVGQAGQLLTKILAAIDLRREDVFICNVLKHRPPGNRNPLPDEVTACSPYLVQQLELIRPKVIVAFGTFAAQTLLNTKLPIGKLRGSVHRYYGIPLIVTYHPAALLRNPAWKRPTWEDVQLARRILDSAPRA